MKKTLLLTAAVGLASASSLMANADLYITGSTAFRANVHDACLKLFSPAPTEITGTAATGGDSKTGNAAAQWVMTGTPISQLSAISGTLTVHALFTGSVQGVQTVENSVKLIFLDSAGARMTNTATIAFSDASSLSTPYPATGNYSEESVAVQPFVMCRSVAANGVTNINNVTWEQLKEAIQLGRIPLSVWTGLSGDHTSFVYLLERTKDSGTRRVELAQELDGFNQSAVIYNYDVTNNVFYHATALTQASTGGGSYGVIGPAGNNNNNVSSLWGTGYVGGGDLRSALGINNAANQSIGYLSFADAKSLGSSNWAQVISFDGLSPTAAGIGVRGNTGTNDFTPISFGTYAAWGNEVVVYPNIDPSSINSDQNLTASQLGNQSTAGTILGVLDGVSTPGNPVIIGSIDNEIENSKTNGATAIRLGDMISFRASVGGTITP